MVSDLISALSVALLPVVDDIWGLSFAWFIALGLLGAVGDVPGMTARDALLPEVCEREGVDLQRFVGASQSMGSLITIAGPAAAALLIGLMPDVDALWVTAACSCAAAAAQEQAAVTHRASTSGMRPMSRAAAAGPAIVMREPMDWLAPTKRWRSTPSRSQTSGSSASRAVMPGTSPTAPRRPSAMNHANERPQISSTTGSRATLSAEMRSETTQTTLRLAQSSSAPPRMPHTNWGTAQMRASDPAARTSPVRASRTSGSTTPAMELPSIESASEMR